VGAKDIVQVFLFRSVILRFTDNAHAQQPLVKVEASVSISNHDRSVVDAEEELLSRPMLLRTFTWRKVEDLDWMAIRVLEVKGRNPTSILVPVRQPLGGGERMFHSVPTKPGIGPFHVLTMIAMC
jgi:hypothetical protein